MEPMKVRLRQDFPPEPPLGPDASIQQRRAPEQHWPFISWFDYDEEGWTYSVHLVVKNDTIICDEIRVKPAEAVESSNPTLLYELSSIPNQGIASTMLHKFRFGQLIKAAIHKLTRPPDSPEGIDWYDWTEEMKAGGLDWAKFDSYTRNQRRGRPPLSEEELALVAYYYDKANREQVKALHAYVSLKLYDTNEFAELVRQRVDKCRKRGFLTEAPAKGVAGGHLTPKAIEVIKRLALEDRQEKGDGE